MKVELYSDKSLMISPETEFEEEFLGKNFDGELRAFLKKGFTASTIIGIRINGNVPRDCDPKSIDIPIG